MIKTALRVEILYVTQYLGRKAIYPAGAKVAPTKQLELKVYKWKGSAPARAILCCQWLVCVYQLALGLVHAHWAHWCILPTTLESQQGFGQSSACP